jgi:acyl carrier protein
MRGAAWLLLIALAIAGGASCSKRSAPPESGAAPERPQAVRPPPPPQATAATTAKVRAVVAEMLEVPVSAISDDMPLAQAPKPADDLAIVEIVLALEETFKIELPDQELEEAAGHKLAADIAQHISVRKLATIVERHRQPLPKN